MTEETCTFSSTVFVKSLIDPRELEIKSDKKKKFRNNFSNKKISRKKNFLSAAPTRFAKINKL